MIFLKGGHFTKDVDCTLSELRNGSAVTKLFSKALSSNGTPSKILIDKSGTYAAGIRKVKRMLKRFGFQAKVQTVRCLSDLCDRAWFK